MKPNLHSAGQVLKVALLAFCALLLTHPMQAGNKYLQQFENYSVMSMGGNVLRFTIPIWVYGEGDDNTYYLRAYQANNDNKLNSYLWYSETNDDTRGSATVHRIASFGGPGRANYDGRKANGVGYAYLLVGDGAGAMVVRNTYSGQALTMMPGDNTYWPVSDVDTAKANKPHYLEVTRQNNSYGKYSTYMVIDWYIPESLQGKNFYIGLNVCDHYAKYAHLQTMSGYVDNTHNNYFWQWRETFSGENPQSPELFDAYFYALSQGGSTPKGKAGVTYVAYQDVAKYTTSLNPLDTVTTTERNGTIVVDMHDTIQPMSATIGIVPNKETGVVQYLRTNRIDIPAYHKIYNFAAAEELDEQGSVSGDVTLTWNTLYPTQEDVMPSDIFEIQRATKPDFSDAVSIGMDALSDTEADYTLTDEGENVRRVLSESDSTDLGRMSTEVPVSIYLDGELAATINATMESNVYMPGSTLYYRIRRGSAAIWDWEESDWMKTTSLVKHDYLAPLSDVQADYTLDPEFEDNRKVHFNFTLNNQAVTNNLDPIDQLPYSFSVAEITDKLPVETRLTFQWKSGSPKSAGIHLDVYQIAGTSTDTLPVTIESETSNSITYVFINHKAANTYYSLSIGSVNLISGQHIPFGYDVSRTLQYSTYGHSWGYGAEIHTSIDIAPQVAEHFSSDSVKQILYNDLIGKVSDVNYGRCSWDQNAKLVLARKYTETGEIMRFVIPNDSVKRQEDGSWAVHFVNEAARNCVHYEYSVYLDQSNSTLKVQNPINQLEPKAINGPELYRNEVARIAEISAIGNKKGVQVIWQPTAGSIDGYTLTRREKGVAGTEKLLAEQSLEGFYDEEAEPGVTYEYIVEASYTCQGTTTKNSATVEGTRLAFGSIAGRVQYEDGTGCYGVEVKIENDGDVVQTTLTDETGVFFFDSLYYTNGAGRQTAYIVTPTSQTAVFIFNNNTSTHSASITMDKNNCEVDNLYFDNISAVRFSGRVLYKNSTVPVRDANILLNGKLVKLSGEPYKTDVSGNFEINVPQNSAFTIQIVKDGHSFEGDGFVRIDGDSLLTLTKALDGVRVWDLTKVRLAGRVVGGQDQAALPLGHGLSKNNLGENIQLVLELEGDNISWIVRDPNDQTKDTLEFTVVHHVYDSVGKADNVGVTKVHYQKKRIIIDVDPTTGEYCADLFPTKYKIIQATARGYATLFAEGKTGEAIDLSNTVLIQDTVTYGNKIAVSNAQFSITYRAPIVVTYKQYRYGMEYDYYGERTYKTQNIAGNDIRIDLVKVDSVTGDWNYLFGAPVFSTAQYQFRVSAHEDYYFNNDRSNKPDIVNLKGGNLKVYNGMQETTSIKQYTLDQNGSALVDIYANHVTYVQDGDMALRQLDFSVESDGEYIEADPLRAYVLGAIEKTGDFLEMDTVSAGITLFDILRDPPGSNSYATLAKGTKYHIKYKTYFNRRFGLDLILKEGNNTEYYIGTVAAPAGAGTAGGVINTVHKSKDWHMTFSFQYYNETESDYEITTTEAISTSSDPYNVGSKADVYIGATNGIMTGKALTFRVVDSLSYEMLASQRECGSALVIAQGTDENGSPWYLMRTEDITVKNALTSCFSYTQEHIIHTVIPELFDYRDALLFVGTEAEAQAAADANGKYIFWSHVEPNDSSFGLYDSYQIVTASTYKGATVDKVDAANKAIINWLHVIAQNEAIKLISYNTTPFSTQSISGGVTQTYSETYAYSDYLRDYWAWLTPIPKVGNNNSGKQQNEGMVGFLAAWANEMFNERARKGKYYSQAMQNLISKTDKLDAHHDPTGQKLTPEEYIKVAAGHTEFDITADPIVDFGSELIPDGSITTGESKTTSFTIAPNPNEHITFQVFKSWVDDFNLRAQSSREYANQTGNYGFTLPIDPLDWWTPADPRETAEIYGSLVFRTIGGATMCPWEDGDSTLVYATGQPLNKPTLKIENPQIVIDKHELSNIPHDGEGYFTIKMWNEIEESEGLAAGSQGIKFTLKMDEGSNPKGLELSIDGVPLSDGREFRFFGSDVITKTVKVRAGQDYDYEDVCLKLESQCTSILTYNKACFSVHFMPVSSPVNISIPSDKWIMNTLSSKDETGYYIPVNIDGFDTHYDNFDHIELQYKLVTQPNDAWVNLCSYYAEDSLYQLASGTKKMIENGKIENFRFYGERDPMEQQYNLRAVSFCRHGSGFITRSSEVLTGTKDTRVPRVFGDPEPADAILGVGDHFLLRFNEPIAGNYLDEDNNFQLTGYTNESGITTGTSLRFDGSPYTYAETKVSRSMSDKSFSIDLLVKPEDPDMDGTFFTYPMENGKLFTFGKTRDNRLLATFSGYAVYWSDPLPEKMTGFTRVIVTYDKKTNELRFYAGTKEVTDTAMLVLPDERNYMGSGTFLFGQNYAGNMLEARVWGRALSMDEISNTHLLRMTGYERDLVAYYPMDEGKGDVLTDKANGATLYAQGATWENAKGISLYVPNDKRVKLDGNLMARTPSQDETMMMWFKTDKADGTIFSAGRIDSKHGTEIALQSGALVFANDSTEWTLCNGVADNEWHHVVLTLNRTFNNASIFVGDKLYAEIAATKLSAVSGAMYFGGNGFEGYVDEFAIFEQALPKSLCESYGTNSPYGDEMGLMAYLPFEEMKENDNGIFEQVFSINDQRLFKTTDGQVVDKIVPLVLEVSDKSDIKDLADKTEYAPVHTAGQLTKMNFDWSFNNDELLINLNMLDREINKQSIYVTVRDVEDLNGNPMASPVMWTAFVDRNSLKWNEREMRIWVAENDEAEVRMTMQVTNRSGKRHTYTIESLPDWLTVDNTYGAINPTEQKTVTFSYTPGMPVGIYEAIVYLTDENGLSEPLHVELNVKAMAPYDEPDTHKFPYNMSVCGQVLIENSGNQYVDTDERDIVYALYHNECVGQAHISYNSAANKTEVYLTVHGDDAMNRKKIRFQLWQASTGKLFDLTVNKNVLFSHGFVYGCGSDEPIVFTTGGSETMSVGLSAGWNWISVPLNLSATEGKINDCMSASEPWNEGDLIKNPNTRQFSAYDATNDAFVGTLNTLHYSQIYMVSVAADNTMRVFGDELAEDSMKIKVRGDGQWSPMPCLFDKTTPISEALTGYYDNAKAGDLIKSHTRFATFTTDKRWVGDLTTLKPGEGYLFRRLAPGTVTIPFYKQTNSNAPRRALSGATDVRPEFYNSHAATNMTMIAKVEGEGEGLKAYIDGELVGVGTAVDSLYFITLQSDLSGTVEFRTANGETLMPETGVILYQADAHAGTLKAPVVLKKNDAGVYKRLENDHVVIIRNNEKYDVTGKKME